MLDVVFVRGEGGGRGGAGGGAGGAAVSGWAGRSHLEPEAVAALGLP